MAAMPQLGARAGRKKQSSASERMARAAIEQSCGCPITDSEWAKQRQRLIEFVQTLSHWDREQRSRNKLENRECSRNDQQDT